MDLNLNKSISGKIIKGSGLGSLLGIPTANIRYRQTSIKHGIYASVVKIKSKYFKGALHIGILPTFNMVKPKIEIHIIDYNKNVLGEKIDIFPIKQLRKIKKFKSIENLTKQIKKDIRNTRKYIDLSKIAR